MMHPLIILVFASVYLREMVGPPVLYDPLGPGGAAGITLGGLVAVWLVAHLWIRLAARRLDRTGRIVQARRADTVLLISRVVAGLFHAVAVLVLGWLDSVRSVLGDVPVADKLVAVAPALTVFVLGWWSMYPVERRLREAVLLREIEQGRTVYPSPSLGRYIIGGVRHQMGVVVVPLVLIMGWTELVETGAGRVLGGGAGTHGNAAGPLSQTGTLLLVGAQLLGVVAVFGLMPQVLRFMWDTVPLGPGELRDQLVDLCRSQGVRVRRFLVWRTHGAMVNGAVIGLFAPLRYILLTDALLDSLPRPQVEAVTAHEVGHLRRHHMVWLGLTLMTSVAAGAIGAGFAVQWWLGPAAMDGWIGVGVTGASLLAGLVVFGYVSRRFEWQADAFAAQHLSGVRHTRGAPRGAEPVLITAESVGAMSDALATVADLNCVPREKFSWRHGSIATRQRRLAALVGVRADRLPIDRQAGRLKMAALVLLLAVGALAASGVAGL
jgi:STE24 endopeptidase